MLIRPFVLAVSPAILLNAATTTVAAPLFPSGPGKLKAPIGEPDLKLTSPLAERETDRLENEILAESPGLLMHVNQERRVVTGKVHQSTVTCVGPRCG